VVRYGARVRDSRYGAENRHLRSEYLREDTECVSGHWAYVQCPSNCGKSAGLQLRHYRGSPGSTHQPIVRTPEKDTTVRRTHTSTIG
jgi:hypothetical protein